MKKLALYVVLALITSGLNFPSHSAERLLLGFEPAEIKTAMEKLKDKPLLQDGDEFVFLQRISGSFGGYEWSVANPRISPNRSTEGKYALKSIAPIPHTADDNEVYPWSRRSCAIFSTMTGAPENVFDGFFPRNWSGFDSMRLEVWIDRPETGFDTVLMIHIGDEDLDPPLEAEYTVPTGKWVTLEFDLERGSTERGLKLERICYFLLRLGPKQQAKKVRIWREWEKATIYVDNIRLCNRNDPANFPVLRCNNSFEYKTIPYAVEYKIGKGEKDVPIVTGWKQVDPSMPKPVLPPREPCPRGAVQPCIIDLSSYKEIDCLHLESLYTTEEVSAFDSRRILVTFCCSLPRRWFPAHDQNITLALGTLDGGTTWAGLDGSQLPTPVMIAHHAPGTVVAMDGDIIIFADWGCQNPGHNYPMHKGFCRRTVFTGNGWWLSPFYFIDAHGHHCVNFQTGVRLPSGRIWTVWEHAGRARSELCARFSDDGGISWQSWVEPGKVSMIPGLYGCNAISAVPLGEHVAVLVRDHAYTGQMTVFDGKTWSLPVRTVDSYRQKAVSVNSREIYIAGHGGVWRWDGSSWKHELTAGNHPKDGPVPALAVCGNTVLCFDLDESKTKLLCWRRISDKWLGPHTVVSEETRITSFATQRYAPQDFAPVVYVCSEKKETIDELIKQGANPRHVRRFKPWIKLIKVPVTTDIN
jgi:hypothetical protein